MRLAMNPSSRGGCICVCLCATIGGLVYRLFTVMKNAFS